MREFIFPFLGAVLGALVSYFIYKAFIINKELNLKSNKDEVLAAMDMMDKEYAEEKVKDIEAAIIHFKSILPYKNASSSKYIKRSLTYYLDWLCSNRAGINHISEAQRNELKAKIEELINLYSEEI